MQGRKRWCCQTDLSGMNLFSTRHCNDVQYIGHQLSLSEPLTITNDIFLQILITVITNFSLLPSVRVLWKDGKVWESFIGFCTMVFSIMYHLGDVTERKLLGMTPGQVSRNRIISAFNDLICFSISITSLFFVLFTSWVSTFRRYAILMLA